MKVKPVIYALCIMVVFAFSCNNNSPKKTHFTVYKGVYSFGPEVKSFKDCDNGTEFWVTDSSEQLELQYSQLKFENPYEPVYIEVEGIKVRSNKDGLGSEYDSTLIVKKLIKITKEIPLDMCN